MSTSECKEREFYCEQASTDVLFAYTEKAIDDGMDGGWIKVGKRSCTGSKICGVSAGKGLPEWGKCSHLPRGRKL